MSAATHQSEITLSADHVYTRGGRVIPSVTQILKETGLVDDQWFTEHSSWRGSAVHLMCHFDDEGDLDESTLDYRLRGYLDAYRLFKAEMKFVATHNEQRVYHETLGYAGTFDIKGTFVHGECLPDIKSGVVSKATRFQTVAYAATQDEPRTLWRFGLGLKPDGKYSLKVYQPKDFDRDFRAWQSIVAFFHIRREVL